jgi:hypothetical protein
MCEQQAIKPAEPGAAPADGTLADVPRKVRSNIVVGRPRRSLAVA